MSIALFLALLLTLFIPASAGAAETKTLRIIGTSDFHGKFLPWDYALNAESTSGSVAQLSTALAQYRVGDTLLLDAGDTIQGNSADIFIGGEDVHPMVQAINALNYDVWVPGNHEYDYGMDVVRKTIADLDCKVLTGNVIDETGAPLADGYAIFVKDGVRIAVIGMVTPNIAKWDAANLADCTVTDPLTETRRIIDAIQGQYDVLAGVYHMGIHNEYDVPNSGVTDILNACPEFDVMISSHEHAEIPGEEINGVLVVQNKSGAQTMAVIDLTLEKDGEGWKVTGKTSETVRISGFEPDPALAELLGKYDEQARRDAEEVIGALEGGPLVPGDMIPGLPTALIQDTALMDLINEVQMYYSGAPVSAAALSGTKANIVPGPVRKCDMALVYKHANTLYTLRMTGSQLKKYMEWTVGLYNTFAPGDLTVSFSSDLPIYQYDMFAGVNYEINVANEPGRRIENLTWPDGSPVREDDVFTVAVSNYRASSQLLTPGIVFGEEDMPELLETDIRGDIGGIRELIGDYIVQAGGVISPRCDLNWKITGCEWDEALHTKAVEMLAAGTLDIPVTGDKLLKRAVTEADVR